jgi:acyl transferase domain-containing protein/acyl carrier protein
MISGDRTNNLDGIAIIGIACRFPGATNVDQFWQNLRDGAESISFFSDEELAAEGISPALLRDPSYIKAGASLDGIKLFDASFFGYSPREAERIDPQQRIFLECAWTALEVAGYCQFNEGQIGVYAGSRVNEYFLNNIYPNGDRFSFRDRIQPMALGDDDNLATRVSYKLNLCGPSLKVQAACSTSLVAIHLGCQALLNGECDLVLAGGVALRLPEKSGYLYQDGSVASPDGHCRSFDARGQGTVFGNGVGVVVLKRLGDAIRDRDHIDAVIKGSAINNDGASKIGFTAPSAEGQARVIAEALEIAGVQPETVSYVEAHGTATSLGDPIEVAALSRAFGAGTQKKQFCAIGSVKSNIGHASAAAGVAGMIKTTLALKHKMLPPSLHFERSNPNIDFSNSPFYVNTKLSEWISSGTPRRAGVSAFGIGGTNAHVVMEEAVVAEASGASRPWQLLLLSAKTGTALETATFNLAKHLEQNPNINLADVAFTLQIGRNAFDHRRALVCGDLTEARQALESRDPKKILTWDRAREDGTVAFMFPGQGSQYVNMGRQLYETEPVFRSQVDKCAEQLSPKLGMDLRRTLYPEPNQTDAAALLLNRTLIAQPALFTVEYAMARLLMSWGLSPSAMIGHSVGEYVAACLAGVFALEEGLTLITARGRLMDGLSGGAMLAVSLPLEEVQSYLSDRVALAAHNAPGLCVLSGTNEAIDEIEKQLGCLNVGSRRLHTSHAFHSNMMEPVLRAFTEEVEKLQLHPPAIPYLSNVSGNWITDSEATDPNYWAEQLRGTVRFSDGLTKLLANFSGAVLEVGPGQSLSAIAKQHNQADQVVLSTTRRAQENHSDIAYLLGTLGRLWIAGVSPDWMSFYGNEIRRRVPLPTYPFERKRYWIDAPQNTSDGKTRSLTLEKKPDIADWFYVPSWKRSVPPQLLEPESPERYGNLWLIFVDDCGVGVEIAKRLQARGADVTRVEAGVKFNRYDRHRFVIDPASRSDYLDLIRSLSEDGSVPSRIVHLWSLSGGYAPIDVDSFELAQPLGFFSLVHLAQALEKNGVVAPLQINLVSNHMQDIDGDQPLRPEKVTALGACKVLPQEYANIDVRMIDIELPSETRGSDGEWLEKLMRELVSKAVDSVIVHRGRHRWVQVFEPVRLTVNNNGILRVRNNCVVLITGGLGRIGLLLACYLAQNFKAKLVLTGRSSLPEREYWETYLNNHDDHEPIAQRIRQVKSIEDFGGRVLTIRADVSSEDQMRSAIAEAERRFGALHGVIHAAGVVGENLMIPVQESTLDGCKPHFDAKARGLMVLDQLLQGKELDFCILISSLSSVLGGLGFCAYAGANLFMDAFACRSAQSGGVPWTSINFGRWSLNDRTKRRRGFAESAATTEISDEEGVEAFRRILCMKPAAQIIVSTRDLEQRISQWNQPKTVIVVDQDAPAESFLTDSTSSNYARPHLANPFTPPSTETERTIANIWQNLLGIHPIGIHDNFLDLGGHSLLATRVMARLREAFKIEISVRNILDAQTVAEIALIITEEQAKQSTGADLTQLLGEIEAITDEEVEDGLDKKET